MAIANLHVTRRIITARWLAAENITRDFCAFVRNVILMIYISQSARRKFFSANINAAANQWASIHLCWRHNTCAGANQRVVKRFFRKIVFKFAAICKFVRKILWRLFSIPIFMTSAAANHRALKNSASGSEIFFRFF